MHALRVGIQRQLHSIRNKAEALTPNRKDLKAYAQ